MKKKPLLFVIVFVAAASVYAQNTGAIERLDSAVTETAEKINAKLNAEKAQKVSVGQFGYRGAIVPLSGYWASQLAEELTNTTDKSFTVLSDGGVGADIIIHGEIIEVVPMIRIYTRIIRAADRAAITIFHSDFERNEYIFALLASQRSGSDAPMVTDINEPDSMEAPIPLALGENEPGPALNRTLHHRSDEDFFLITPEQNGQIIMETTGEIDTRMYLYNADTKEQLASNDDGGSGSNARITRTVETGKRYIAKVTGYSGTTGSYGFQARFLPAAQLTPPDEYENDDNNTSAQELTAGTPQTHSFHHTDDVDWVTFQITQPGRYTIRARGVRSTNLDTFIELFDAELNEIGEDDDSGDGYSSRLSQELENGVYYVRVRCLDDEPDDSYTISVAAE